MRSLDFAALWERICEEYETPPRFGLPDRNWSEKLNENRYREWAGFIDSVRSTLEILIIEQGTEPELNVYFCRRKPSQTGFPIYDRFLKIVLPVITQELRPVLKMTEIIGLGSQPR